MSIHMITMSTPVGELRLVGGDAGLTAVLWPDDTDRVPLPADLAPEGEHPVLAEARRQLDEYFAGSRTSFDLPLDLRGTDFQQRAWRSLAQIPYGETLSYREQAELLGDPRLARAVGTANGRNPLSIVLPCHRVVGSDGSLTGYAAGLDAKRFLLELERRVASTP